VDEAISRSIRQQTELERVADEQMRSMAACFARVESLEISLADESASRALSIADEAAARGELEKVQAQAVELLEQSLLRETDARGELEKVQAQAVELLERNLMQETEARCELEKVLGKDLREHVALEVEGIREMSMREMRERMDGQKVLREEVQLQQQALMGLTSRIDEALLELRTELPTLKQESASHKMVLEKVAATQASGAERLDTLEASIAEETWTRREAERALSADLRERLEAEETLSARRSNDLDGQFSELCRRLGEVRDDTLASKERLLKHADEAARLRESSKQLDSQLRSLQGLHTDQADDFRRKLGDAEVSAHNFTDSKVRECEASMRGWVEITAVGRLDELDKILQKEMTERVASVKDLLDKTAHNTERWSQLQAKFDELLIEVL
jgi:hypothetical protein